MILQEKGSGGTKAPPVYRTVTASPPPRFPEDGTGCSEMAGVLPKVTQQQWENQAKTPPSWSSESRMLSPLLEPLLKGSCLHDSPQDRALWAGLWRHWPGPQSGQKGPRLVPWSLPHWPGDGFRADGEAGGAGTLLCQPWTSPGPHRSCPASR